MTKYIQLMTKVHIHPFFWAIAGLAVLTGYFWELAALFFIVFLHECGHATAAAYFSWRIRRIVLLPFGGVCEVDEHGNRPLKEELIITLAGPLQHVIIAGTVIVLGNLELLPVEYAGLLHQMNAMVFLFNLLPILPLDGGKLWRLLLTSRFAFSQALRFSLQSSFAFLLVLHLICFVFFPFHLNIWIVLGFLYFSLWTEWKQQRFVFMRFLLERHYGKQAEFEQLHNLEAAGEESLLSAMERFRRGCKHLVVIAGKGKLDENELLYAYFTEKQVDAKLKDLVYEE